MTNKDNRKNNVPNTNAGEATFPLVFGIVAVILMALISHFIGN